MPQPPITREEFDAAVEALWSEIQYQNALPRRTDDEAKDIPGFLTLAGVYERDTAEAWARNPGPVEEAMHGMRKIAAIYVRGMIKTGIRHRDNG